jgi:hypothetical protein
VDAEAADGESGRPAIRMTIIIHMTMTIVI